MTILVTGGSGFIGSNYIFEWFNDPSTRGETLINLDALTYATFGQNLANLNDDPRYHFVNGNIKDKKLVKSLLADFTPRAIIHMAAESHVDRSLQNPGAFIETNVTGTYALLESAYEYWQDTLNCDPQSFRFYHVSTDEVYGSLGHESLPFKETSCYAPNSPYSASKAAGDHLVRSWHKTYGLPVVITHCSNNYGPYQHPEKLIPKVIFNALEGSDIPVYGDGGNRRDWIYVEDNCRAMREILRNGRIGENYCIGTGEDHKNIDVVYRICELLDEMHPDSQGPYSRLIKHVIDRPGHDYRYSVDSGKINRELGWRPAQSLESGLVKTIAWYLARPDWLSNISLKT